MGVESSGLSSVVLVATLARVDSSESGDSGEPAFSDSMIVVATEESQESSLSPVIVPRPGDHRGEGILQLGEGISQYSSSFPSGEAVSSGVWDDDDSLLASFSSS